MISGLIFLGILLAVIIGGTIAVAIDSKRHPWPGDPSDSYPTYIDGHGNTHYNAP